jgi:hypothetical protein
MIAPLFVGIVGGRFGSTWLGGCRNKDFARGIYRRNAVIARRGILRVAASGKQGGAENNGKIERRFFAWFSLLCD